MVRRGGAWPGGAWRGMARQGKGCFQREAGFRFPVRVAPIRGAARLGMARPGLAWQGRYAQSFNYGVNAMDNELFFGGVPVGPDVDILDRRYPELKNEQMLTHAELSAAIGYSWQSSRYRTVLNAWRKQLFEERGLELQAVRSVGLRVMTSPERVEAHINKTIGGIRAITKAGMRIAAVPRAELPEPSRIRADNAQAAIAKMNVDMRRFRSSVCAPPAPPTQQPRLVSIDRIAGES